MEILKDFINTFSDFIMNIDLKDDVLLLIIGLLIFNILLIVLLNISKFRRI